MIKNNRRIAILGAGGLGVCVALELSRRGYKVDIYEESSTPINKASYVNEGKIHLGFIYAMDRDFHTAKTMIIGALHFISNLKRWIDIDPEKLISTPFNYCVHKGSLMNSHNLFGHYQSCINYFNEAKSHYKEKYLGLFDELDVKLLSSSKSEQIVNPEYFEAVFETSEYAMDPRKIAEKLRFAVKNDPSCNLILDTKIETVERDGSYLIVNGISGDEGVKISEKYTDVINTSWNGLLKIDKSMGIEIPDSWSFRYKFGNRILIPIQKNELPSCTIIQGPFGDTVNFKEAGAFISWYPIGRTGWSEDIRPPEWDEAYTLQERLDIFSRSFTELTKRIPNLSSLKFSNQDVSPVGGVIYALGNTDVDNFESKLHTRSEVGINSYDNYHTVNTGKYTLIPLLAVKVADRIENKN